MDPTYTNLRRLDNGTCCTRFGVTVTPPVIPCGELCQSCWRVQSPSKICACLKCWAAFQVSLANRRAISPGGTTDPPDSSVGWSGGASGYGETQRSHPALRYDAHWRRYKHE